MENKNKNVKNKKSPVFFNIIFFTIIFFLIIEVIIISCGFNKKEKTKKNIRDFVDFVTLGLSLEEKKQVTFNLANGFNLAQSNFSCTKIDYSWIDSSSGYNPVEEAKAIEKVKFIDNDKFTLRLTSFHCQEGGSGDLIEFEVIDPTTSENGNGYPYQYIAGEKRIYRVADGSRSELEIEQNADCTNGCSSGDSILFLLKSFKLEDGAIMFSIEQELLISFTNGEPIPAFELKHTDFLNETYDATNGSFDLGQVWECSTNDIGSNSGSEATCSGQLMKNLHVTIIDNKSISGGVDAFSNPNDASENELKLAIEYNHFRQQSKSLSSLTDHLIEVGGDPNPPLAETDAFSGASNLTRHGIKAQSRSEVGFYDNLTKYLCIYSVGLEDGTNDLKWSDLGAKCMKLVLEPVDPTTELGLVCDPWKDGCRIDSDADCQAASNTSGYVNLLYHSFEMEGVPVCVSVNWYGAWEDCAQELFGNGFHSTSECNDP